MTVVSSFGRESVVPSSNQQSDPALAPEDDAAIPGLAENDVDTLCLPDSLLIQRIAAGRYDAVDSKEDLLPGLRLLAAGNKALLHERLYVQRRARPEPRDDPGLAVGGCRRKVEQLGPLLARERRHVTDERRAVVSARDQDLPGRRLRGRAGATSSEHAAERRQNGQSEEVSSFHVYCPTSGMAVERNELQPESRRQTPGQRDDPAHE